MREYLLEVVKAANHSEGTADIVDAVLKLEAQLDPILRSEPLVGMISTDELGKISSTLNTQLWIDVLNSFLPDNFKLKPGSILRVTGFRQIADVITRLQDSPTRVAAFYIYLQMGLTVGCPVGVIQLSF